jgi:hypothetical protein
VRAINPRCVQSSSQVEFLRDFAAALTHSVAGESDPTDVKSGNPLAERKQEKTTWH